MFQEWGASHNFQYLFHCPHNFQLKTYWVQAYTNTMFDLPLPERSNKDCLIQGLFHNHVSIATECCVLYYHYLTKLTGHTET